MTQIVTQGRERLRQGFWIVVYPEGTRIRAGTRAHYKTGGARLAIALDIPIVPVAHNAGYLWPKGDARQTPRHVTVSIGPPIRSDRRRHAAADQRGRDLDRKRSRAAGRSAGRSATTSRRLTGAVADPREGSAAQRHAVPVRNVDYRLFRARRRSIGMVIDHSGLGVRAPSWVSDARDRARACRACRLDHQDARRMARARQIESLPAEWRAGAALLFQGRPLTLALFPARKKTIAADLLHLTVLHPTPGGRTRDRGFRRSLAEGSGAGAARAAGRCISPAR